MGKLYGLGVGPGDLELITIKSIRILNEVDIIFCPIKKKGVHSFAYNIVKDHIKNSNAEVINLLFPMSYNTNTLNNCWKENGQAITELLKGDKKGAFVTLGDTTIYSTFMNVLPFIDESLVDTEIVPGVTSFSTIASEENIPLMSGNESLVVIPINKKNNTNFSKVIKDNDNIVLMKPSNKLDVLIRILREQGLENNFILISKVGTKDRKVIKDIKKLECSKIPYLSTMIIKKGGIK
jgi:precorrin-2/cobalt-factor-2 C20-methyltransferase